MSAARARAFRGLQSALRSNTARATPRVSSPARTQLAVGRRYASSGGHGHAEPSSDIPWLIGGIAVTVPTCWYLWPTAHADSGHHGGHDEHAEEEHSEEKTEEEAEEAPAEDDATKAEDESSKEQGEDKEAAAAEKTPKDQQEQGKVPGEPSASGKASGSQGEGQDTGSTSPTAEAQPKEGGEGADRNKGMVKEGSDAAQNAERKVEPDNKGGKKTRIDSGLAKDLGRSEEQFEEDGREKPATSKPPRKITQGENSEGEITSKQFGLSNTPTRHSHDIANDPEKSKKAEGGPDTAKVMGTVDPNRKQV